MRDFCLTVLAVLTAIWIARMARALGRGLLHELNDDWPRYRRELRDFRPWCKWCGSYGHTPRKCNVFSCR